MKIYKFLLLLLSISIISSCENEPIDPAISLIDIPVVVPATFKVTFDGQEFVSSAADAAIFMGNISISAFRNPAVLENFTISLDGATVGSYLANENLISYSPGIGSPELYNSINPDDSTANTGQITITAIDNVAKTISGTFNFTGYYDDGNGAVVTKQFSNGIFINILYSE